YRAQAVAGFYMRNRSRAFPSRAGARCRPSTGRQVGESCNAPSDYAQAGKLQRDYGEARIQSRPVGVNQERSESANLWGKQTGWAGGSAYSHGRKSRRVCRYRTDQAASRIFRAAAAHPITATVFERVGGVGEKSPNRVRR